jgi:hypothetical protein
MLAALAEYSCVRHGFLEQWWFVPGMKSLHANAMVHRPISFKRRGVFITEGALTYA